MKAQKRFDALHKSLTLKKFVNDNLKTTSC